MRLGRQRCVWEGTVRLWGTPDQYRLLKGVRLCITHLQNILNESVHFECSEESVLCDSSNMLYQSVLMVQ